MGIFNFFKNNNTNNQMDIQVSSKNPSAPAEKQITTENESKSIDRENSYPVYAEYNLEIEEKINRIKTELYNKTLDYSFDDVSNDYDARLDEAIQVAIDAGIASTSLIQRKLKIGYARAEIIIDEMEQLGIIGPHKGAMPRDVLMTYNEWLEKRNEPKSNVTSRHIQHPTQKHTTHQMESNNNKRLTIDDIIYQKLGFKPDYSDDGFFVKKFDNYIFPQFSGEPSTLINGIIKYSSVYTVKLLLCDFGTCYEQFRGIPSLFIPLVSEPKKAVAAITWLNNELQQRYKVFSEYGCKDINSYNELIDRNLDYIKNNPPIEDKTGELVQPVLSVNGLPVAKEKMSYIVCSVSEFYNLSSYNELDEALVNLLLNSKKAGIYLFLFSQLSSKSLNLGIKTDLLKVGNQNDIDYFFEKTGEFANNKTIDDIDNNMNGYDFEQFCGDLLKSNGFSNINVTKSSGDYGADLTAIKDGVKYAIQCKKFSNSVGVSAVQEVIASKSMYNCHVAVVLTNNFFTNNAISLAEKNNVLLWDRNKLIAMMNTKKNAESN